MVSSLPPKKMSLLDNIAEFKDQDSDEGEGYYDGGERRLALMRDGVHRNLKVSPTVVVKIVTAVAKTIKALVKFGKKIKDKRKRSVCMGWKQDVIDSMARRTLECVEDKNVNVSSSKKDKIPECWEKGTCSTSVAFELMTHDYENRSSKCFIGDRNRAALEKASKEAAR